MLEWAPCLKANSNWTWQNLPKHIMNCVLDDMIVTSLRSLVALPSIDNLAVTQMCLWPHILLKKYFRFLPRVNLYNPSLCTLESMWFQRVPRIKSFWPFTQGQWNDKDVLNLFVQDSSWVLLMVTTNNQMRQSIQVLKRLQDHHPEVNGYEYGYMFTHIQCFSCLLFLVANVALYTCNSRQTGHT